MSVVHKAAETLQDFSGVEPKDGACDMAHAIVRSMGWRKCVSLSPAATHQMMKPSDRDAFARRVDLDPMDEGHVVVEMDILVMYHALRKSREVPLIVQPEGVTPSAGNPASSTVFGPEDEPESAIGKS